MLIDGWYEVKDLLTVVSGGTQTELSTAVRIAGCLELCIAVPMLSLGEFLSCWDFRLCIVDEEQLTLR